MADNASLREWCAHLEDLLFQVLDILTDSDEVDRSLRVELAKTAYLEKVENL